MENHFQINLLTRLRPLLPKNGDPILSENVKSMYPVEFNRTFQIPLNCMVKNLFPKHEFQRIPKFFSYKSNKVEVIKQIYFDLLVHTLQYKIIYLYLTILKELI